MHGVGKVIIVLTAQESDHIKSVIARWDKAEALRILEQVLAGKIEIVHKRVMVKDVN